MGYREDGSVPLVDFVELVINGGYIASEVFEVSTSRKVCIDFLQPCEI